MTNQLKFVQITSAKTTYSVDLYGLTADGLVYL